MDTLKDNRVLVKIFVGFEMTIDLAMHLNQSNEWKEASVIKDEKLNQIQEVHFNEKDYIGKLVESKMLTLKEIQTLSAHLRQALREFCPNLNVEALKITIFPQVFVS